MELPDLRALQDALTTETADEIIPRLESLVERLPAYVAAHVLLARAYEAGGRTAEARRAWQQAYFFMPGSPVIEEGLRRTAPEPLQKAGFDTVPEGPAPAPEQAAKAVPATDDLDLLIAELEGARIEPVPRPEDVPAPDLGSDGEDLLSETLARIYAAQGQYMDAARVYARLADQDPERAADFWHKAAEMNEQARG